MRSGYNGREPYPHDEVRAMFPMEIPLSGILESFIRWEVEQGRFCSKEEAVTKILTEYFHNRYKSEDDPDTLRFLILNALEQKREEKSDDFPWDEDDEWIKRLNSSSFPIIPDKKTVSVALIQQLNCVELLKKGWDGFKADPIDPWIIQTVKNFAMTLDLFPSVPYVLPRLKGGLLVAWSKGRHYLDMEFLNPNLIAYRLSDGKEVRRRGHITADFYEMLGLVYWYEFALIGYREAPFETNSVPHEPEKPPEAKPFVIY